MKILVTGGSDYIGSILMPELLKRNHRVVVLDNFMYNQTSLLDCCHDKKLSIICGDVRDRQLVSRCLRGVDAIRMILELRSKEQIIIFSTSQSIYGAKGGVVFVQKKHHQNQFHYMAFKSRSRGNTFRFRKLYFFKVGNCFWH